MALGDSVKIGAKDKLTARLGPGFSLSAEVGRQATDFVAIAQRLKREGHAPDAMIIQMGNNGPLYSDEMEDLRKATSEVGEVAFPPPRRREPAPASKRSSPSPKRAPDGTTRVSLGQARRL